MNARALKVIFAALMLAACTANSAVTPGPTNSAGASLAPTPVASGNASGHPTTSAPTGQPTPAPTSTPTSGPTPAPTASWTEPVPIATGEFVSVDMAIDAAGAIYVAAAPPPNADADHAGIWYLTNATGSWTEQRVSTPASTGIGVYDGTPSIALDPDGSVGIAFTRWSCSGCASEGIYYVNSSSGSWSDAVQLAGHDCQEPSLAFVGHVIEMAYQQGNGDGPVLFGSTAIGTWESAQLVKRGSSPSLALDSNGLAGLLFQTTGVHFIQQNPNGTVNNIEAVTGNIQAVDLQLAYDPTIGQMWAAWTSPGDGGQSDTSIATRTVIGWSQPLLAIPGGDSNRLGVVDRVAQLIAREAHTGDDRTLLGSTNATGAFVVEPISPTGGDVSSLAVDPAGRAHVVYAGSDSSAGLWYVIGPEVGPGG